MRAVALAATVVVGAAGLTLSTPAGATNPSCDGHQATLVGTDGDDVLTGTGKADVIMGLKGNDRIEGLGGGDVVCGGPGADVLLGGTGDDDLQGGLDAYSTNAAGATLTGDVLDGGPGDDVMDGGYDDRRTTSIERADTFSYASAGRGVTVDLSGRRTPGVGHATGQGHDTLVLSKRMAVTGSAHQDRIVGSPGRDRLDGGAGNDTIDAGGGFDYILPDGVDDQPGNDAVAADPGPDVVSSLTGKDQLAGGSGADHIEAFSHEPSVVEAGSGDDYVGQYVTPGDGAVSEGGDGDDVVTFYGRLLEGQTPRAVFTVDLRTGVTYSQSTPSGTGTVSGFEGYRLVDDVRWRFFGSALPERVWAIGGGPLRAVMGAGNDRITGTGYDERFDGGDGNDAAYGGGGDDRCVSVERGNC